MWWVEVWRAGLGAAKGFDLLLEREQLYRKLNPPYSRRKLSSLLLLLLLHRLFVTTTCNTKIRRFIILAVRPNSVIISKSIINKRVEAKARASGDRKRAKAVKSNCKVRQWRDRFCECCCTSTNAMRWRFRSCPTAGADSLSYKSPSHLTLRFWLPAARPGFAFSCCSKFCLRCFAVVGSILMVVFA